MARSEIEGLKELERSIQNLGKLPQTCVTKAARSGASVAYKAAKAEAPVDKGDLKQGIIMKAEKRNKPGKKVYDVMMDPAKNNIFVKMSKNGKRAYYPASQEYGFFARNGRYIPGYRYLKKSIVDHTGEIEQKMVDVLSKEIDKELSKR